MNIKKFAGGMKLALIASLLCGFLAFGTGCESNKCCHKESPCSEKKPCAKEKPCK